MKANMMKAYLTVMNKIASFKNNEDGMETVQAIILIVVGLVVVAGLVAILTGGTTDGTGGILGTIKTKIEGLINNNGSLG